MSQEQLNSVNQHYLDRVMQVADVADIKATEDIFDARGMKLVAKGAPISRSVQEKLAMRRLTKPFETSIAIDSGVDVSVIVTEAQRIADTVEPVRSILRAINGGPPPVQALAGLQFGSAMSTMLTLIQRAGGTALEHGVTVSLLSVCLARKLGLGGADQAVVALAGLLHDIGELYIDPQYLHSPNRLSPQEWRHVVVHPRIGQMLIAGLESYPAAVAQAVGEHHERSDGSGYPRRIAGSSISLAGQIVSVAEMMSGIVVNKDKPLQRAELALKVIPGEHAHPLVSAVSSVMQCARGENDARYSAAPSGEERARVQGLYRNICEALEMAQRMIDSAELKSQAVNHLLSEALRRTVKIQRACSSIGLDACLQESAGFFETHNVDVLFETTVVTREIAWRMRDIARDLSLQASELQAHEMESLQPLVALLDGGH